MHACHVSVAQLIDVLRSLISTHRVAMQAVALVFDHISLNSEELQPAPASPGSQAAAGTSSGSANAALKLLDDLCLMASGECCQLWCSACIECICIFRITVGDSQMSCIQLYRLRVRLAAVAHFAKVVRAGAAGLRAGGKRAHLPDCGHL